MKSSAFFLMIVLLSVSLFAQSDQKIMTIHRNGQVIAQQALSDIDSITFNQGAAMNLSSPANGATEQPITLTFSWEAYTGATSYTLQVSKNSSFTSYVYNQSGITGTSRVVSGLESETVFYWRMRAEAAYTLAWSETRSFTTEWDYPSICGQSFVYEGRTYGTTQIGSRCWMATNLNVGAQIISPASASSGNGIEKYCYDNIASNCETYGGLYQWEEMMQYVTTEGARGICPPNWHIPTEQEMIILFDTQGAGYLQDYLSGCGLKNEFNLPMGGYYTGGQFNYISQEGFLWTSTYNFGNPMGLNSPCGLWEYTLNQRNLTLMGLSVRCVKD